MASDHLSRREFFHQAARTTGGLLALSAPFSLFDWISPARAAVGKRAYAAGVYAIELDGVACGFVKAIEGGNIKADVVTEPPGPDNVLRKHLGLLRIEPITMELGMDMAKPMYDWISAALNGQGLRKNGAIIAADFNYKEIGRRTFSNALITEVEFPALDAASKEAARMTITLRLESLRFDPPSMKPVGPPAGQKGQKLWIASNFRLSIQGLEQATARVNKIEALVIKQKVAEEAVGQMRDLQKQPAALEVPNLIVTLPESHSGLFYAWHQDFVIKGNNGPEKEKPGILEFLSPDSKAVLAAVQFSNLGIFKVAPEPLQGGADAISRVKAEMYCEKITAKFNA